MGMKSSIPRWTSNGSIKIDNHELLDRVYQIWYNLAMKPILNASFFRSDSGNEPVREWLKALSATDRRIMGEDIKTVQPRFSIRPDAVDKTTQPVRLR
jgi:hypothetical protein